MPGEREMIPEPLSEQELQQVKQEVSERLRELRAEAFELRSRIIERWTEIGELETILKELEKELDPDAKKQSNTTGIKIKIPVAWKQRYDQFVEFRKKLTRPAQYMKMGALGAVATAGMGMVTDPEKFFYNLGYNIAFGAAAGTLEDVVRWMEHRAARALRKEENDGPEPIA